MALKGRAGLAIGVRAAADHDFNALANVEMKARKALGYPPFTRVLKILVRGRDGPRVEAEADALGRDLRAAGIEGVVGILGPAPSPRAYLAGKYRWQFLIKGSYRGVRGVIAAVANRRGASQVERILDVDPFHLL